ncbi:MAG: hypothetical protein KJ606_07200 [Chloroflexi bacterium]|nr:hypothetical protein [Chloroflexota bacterium]
MSTTTPNLLPAFQVVTEPSLLFHPDRNTDIDIHPLRGLSQFGPYSRSHNFKLRDPICIGVLCPSGTLPRVVQLFNDLHSPQQPKERKQYLQYFDGFSKVFGIGLDCPHRPQDERVCELPTAQLEATLKDPEPQQKIAEIFLSGVRQLVTKKHLFDVLVVYLPDRLSSAFRSPLDDSEADFDLHDTLKATCAAQGIPVQVLNDDALTYFCRCSVAWRLSLAIYTKAGGIPWKLAGFDTRHAYVGLSYSLRKGSHAQFVTCCSQIFDAEGTNLRFLLYESQGGLYEGENPYLSRQDMRRVMARTIDLYQRQKGTPPIRLVIHKTTQFRPEEIDGCIDALGSIDDLELLTISTSMSWHAIRINAPKTTGPKGEPAMYPVERGTFLPLGSFEYALWTQGNASGIGTSNYFKEGKGIPHPILVTRYLGTGGAHASARELLGLTKMNWNNDSLYDRLPVTLSYASILARMVKRLGTLSNNPYDFRFFM